MEIKTIKFARTITGGDVSSKVSKLSGTSFSLSAFYCHKGNDLAKIKGSVCEQCYAKRGNYIYSNVQKGLSNSAEKVREAMQSIKGMMQWVDAMVYLIEKRNTNGFHRWHASGDLQNARHFRAIVLIAQRLPHIQFWLPTKEKRIIEAYEGILPDNLSVRLSASMIDAKPPKTRYNTSTVHKNGTGYGFVCPAPKQGGKCLDCTACYNTNVKNVSYHKH